MNTRTQVTADGIELDLDFRVEYKPTYPCAKCGVRVASLSQIGIRSYCGPCRLEIESRELELIS